jgi:hypothetical protein
MLAANKHEQQGWSALVRAQLSQAGLNHLSGFSSLGIGNHDIPLSSAFWPRFIRDLRIHSPVLQSVKAGRWALRDFAGDDLRKALFRRHIHIRHRADAL